MTKNCRSITLTVIVPEVYNALILKRIQSEIEKILKKKGTVFGELDPQQILTIYQGKMEQILLSYDLPKETFTAIMILYKNTKVMVPSPDGDADYFNIVAGVLQGYT